EWQLDQPRATAVSSVAARCAPAPALERDPRNGLLGQQRYGAGVRLVAFPAFRTDLAHKTLSQHRFDGRRDQVGLDLEIQQPRHGAGRVVRVERGEYEVAC